MYLGLDIGTYETKGVLMEAGGRVLAEAARRHELLVPQPGWAEHDPEGTWWGDTVHVIRQLLATSDVDPKSIRAVAPSAIGPCLVATDEDGRAVGPGILYGVDTRASAEVDELTTRIGEEAIVARCGNALTSQSVGPKLLWLKRNRPEAYEKAATFHTSTGFVVERLTGARVIDAYTAANMAPFYDAATGGWSDALGSDVDLSRLPAIRPTTTVAGTVTRAAAEATGLAKGTPVTVGTVDAAAEAVSVGVLRDRQMMVMMGSTIFIIMPTAERVADARLWYAPWLFSGQHSALAGLATSGTLTHWFRENFARELGDDAFAVLAAEAEASPPGANGLTLLPHFSGERTPVHDPDARGLLHGLDLTHTRGDIYRAFLEGIALGTAWAIEAFGEAGAAPRELVAVGGGTRNEVWLQATSDATGLPQTIRRRSTGASFGNALLAAIAVGDAEAGDIEDWNPVERVVEPRGEHAGLYAERLGRFRRLYEAVRGA